MRRRGSTAGIVVENQNRHRLVSAAVLGSTAVGVLNVTGATISGFAPYLGGLARRTIGIGQLMAYASLAYLATSLIILYAILRECLQYVASLVKAGISTQELDEEAEAFICERGGEPVRASIQLTVGPLVLAEAECRLLRSGVGTPAQQFAE